MMLRLIASLGCAAALVHLPAQAQNGADERLQRNILVVSGTGEAHAAPDVAYVTLGVTTQGKRAQEAAQANAAASQKVMDAVRGQGVAQKDIQTSGLSIQPQYETAPGRQPAITGYMVSNIVRVTVRDLKQIGQIVDASLDAGANNVQGVSFGLEERRQAESAALTEAMQDARRKAEVLAKAGGVPLGPVVRIEESSFRRPGPLFAGGEVALARAATPVSPGEMTVSANVIVAFEINGRRVGAAPQ